MIMVIIHSRLSITILLYLIILCFWGAFRYLRKEQVNGSFLGALTIAEVLIILQGFLCVFLYFQGSKPERGLIHILYGFVGVLGIPMIYTISKGSLDRQVILVYTAVLFLNAVLIIRSIMTG